MVTTHSPDPAFLKKQSPVGARKCPQKRWFPHNGTTSRSCFSKKKTVTGGGKEPHSGGGMGPTLFCFFLNRFSVAIITRNHFENLQNYACRRENSENAKTRKSRGGCGKQRELLRGFNRVDHTTWRNPDLQAYRAPRWNLWRFS